MGGGKSQTSTQSVTIPPEVLARYNAVNARAEQTAAQPFQQYGGEFVAPLTPTQQAGVQATSAYSQSAQPFYGAGAGLTLGAAQPVGALTQGQIGYYQNPYTQSVVGSTLGALGQQFGQQQSQQQTEAIKAGAFGGDRAGIQRAQLMGQQGLAAAQAIAPLYQQGYQQAVQTAQGQQGVIASDLARQLQAGQQIAALGTGAQQAALQGAQAQIGAGTLEQQTQQAQDTAQYQQFLQERGYPFQVAQFLANIAEGTGALSGSTTTTTQPSSFFSDRRLKHDAEKIGETKDGLPIYSFKYNGDDRTQIGLMAQDVEKKHPEAVGLAGGYKTVDYEKALHPSKKAYGGGLDPNSMGGVVSEPGAFYRGGYATAGAVVDPTDLSAILQQQRQAFGPFAAAGPYGQAAGAAPHGPSGIVPQQQMHVPKLITAGAAPRPTDSGFSDVYKGYQGLNQIADDMTGKSLTRRFGEKTGLTQTPEAKSELAGNILPSGASASATGGVNPTGNAAPMPLPRDETATAGSGFGDFLSGLNPFKSEGGGIMPRQHFEGGGASVNPYAARDPSEGYIDDTIQEEDKTKTPEMLKPGGGAGGGKSGGLGSDIMGAAGLIGAGKTLFSAGSSLASFLPTLFLAEGGVVPRQHFKGGGFDDAYQTTLQHEGGYAEDTGGPTMMGISSRANPDVDLERVKNDPEYRRDIYRTRYWEPIGAENLDPKLQGVAYDTAVNLGVGKTRQLLAQAENDPTKLLQLRQQHYDSLVKNNPETYGQYAKGWNSRVNSFARQLGVDPLPYAAPEGGMSSAAGQQAIQRATSGKGEGLGAGQEKPGFFESNKQYILPLLQGLGAMAGSKSRYLGSALLEGLGAGAKAYGDVEQQRAQTEGQEATNLLNMQNIMFNSIKNIGTADRPIYMAVLSNGKMVPLNEWMETGGDLIGGKLAPAYARSFLEAVKAKAAGRGALDQGQEGEAISGPKMQQPVSPALSEPAPIMGLEVKPGSWKEYKSQELKDMQSPGAPEASANSKAYAASVAQMGNGALTTKPQTNEMVGIVSDLYHGTAADKGGANARAIKIVQERINDLADRAGLGKNFFGNISTYADAMDKLNAVTGRLQATAAGQTAYESMAKNIGALPDPNRDPVANLKNASLIMVDRQRQEDQWKHAQAYGRATGNLYNRALDHFNESKDPSSYQAEANLLENFLATTNPVYIKLMTTNRATPAQIEEFFQDWSKKNNQPYIPGMSRYFSRRQ